MNSIQGATILITGGAGFVGSTTADQLLDAGAAQIRVLDNFVRGNARNLERALATKKVVVMDGDICDADTVETAVQGVDYIFHMAALRITRCAEVPKEGVDVLIHGTVNVLESAVRNHVKKIVAASSASVYGDPLYLPMDEAHPFNNRTLYGACKIANEQILRSYYEMYHLPYVALRYFNIYGPRMDLDGVYTEVLVRWMDAIQAGVTPKIFGDGLQSMDFVYVEDVARANLAALTSEAEDDVFNVGTGVETTLNELAHHLLKLYGSSLQPEYHPARKVNNVRARRATVEHAQDKLGFKSSVNLESGLRGLIEWREEIKASMAFAGGSK